MPYNDDEVPPPPRPGLSRPTRAVRLSKHYNSSAPLAPNDQKVLLELKGMSSAASRAPLDLVAVIDVSSSMKKEGRLDKAKKALNFIIRKLTARDRLCIIKFENEVKRLCPLRCVTDAARSDLEAHISGLQARGWTNIEAGLKEGLAVIGDRKFTAGRAASIMLLSDGEENTGSNARSVEPGSVAVHTFGFGADHDSALLAYIANRSRGGTYNYVADSNDPAKLSKAFSKILAGLVTIIAQDLELTVKPYPGKATIKNVYAGTHQVDPVGDGSTPVTVRFGTLSSEAVQTVIVELALSDPTKIWPHRATIAEVLYRFTTALGQQVTSDPEKITIKRSWKLAATPADTPPPVEVEVIRQQHVDTIRKAVDMADQRKLKKASKVLDGALKKLAEARKKLFDPILEDLHKELTKLLELLKTYDLYMEHGRHYAQAVADSHGRRQPTEKGDDEDSGPYDTQRVKKYRVEAQLSRENDLATAAEEEEEVKEEDEESQPEVSRRPVGERRTVAVALRLLTAVLSLLAFSIMASASTSGWAGDYYGRYEPYRYTVGVNVIICFYSIAQAFIEIRRPISPRFQTISCYCIGLFLDQGLAYLLISSSSAAASRHHLWVSRFGKDRFNDKINVAVWFSFLVFLTLSGNTLISMANLFSRI